MVLILSAIIRVERRFRIGQAVDILRKCQMHGVEKGDSKGQVAFISGLFGAAA